MKQLSFVVVMIVTLVLGGFAPLDAQSDEGLTPGDVVRVDRDFVGTLMSIDDQANLTVLGEGKPVCWPGIGHGEGPRCDPAPPVRRVVDWRGTTIERQVTERSYAGRMIVGFLLGAAVGAPLGYVTGPSLGYGKIDGCVENDDSGGTVLCTNPIPADEAAAMQRSQDQRRGALFLGAVMATAGTIVARKTVDEWVEVQPPGLVGESAWSLGVRMPIGNE